MAVIPTATKPYLSGIIGVLPAEKYEPNRACRLDTRLNLSKFEGCQNQNCLQTCVWGGFGGKRLDNDIIKKD